MEEFVEVRKIMSFFKQYKSQKNWRIMDIAGESNNYWRNFPKTKHKKVS